ncbi:hypothetical protein GCM10027287_25860 [Bordetella muralis]
MQLEQVAQRLIDKASQIGQEGIGPSMLAKLRNRSATGSLEALAQIG